MTTRSSFATAQQGIEMFLRIRAFTAFLILLAGATALGEDDATSFQLPLVGNLCVCRSGDFAPTTGSDGKYQLDEIEKLPSGNFTYHVVIPRIQKIAVVQNRVVGIAGAGYFSVNGEIANPSPVFFQAIEGLQAALKADGSSSDVRLNDPEVLAAGVPEKILRPWEYRMMDGKFGLTDDLWSLVVQGLGLLIAFLLGTMTPPAKSPLATMIVLGVLTDIVAQIVIAGEGPGGFVGLFVFPMIYYFAAIVGKGFRWMVTKRPRVDVQPIDPQIG